jgi:tetratricopeptide (TPR) repeat protein
MLEFIDNKSDKTIIKAVRSALNKSRLSEDAIDNILFVGGSCLNPYIVECVSALLPDASKIIPRNLQTHVSSGSAINCFLVKGLQINPLTPIISEPISVKTKDERTVVIIDSGTEIPSKGFIVDGFKLSNKDQKIIEIPIYVSGSKLLQTTRINLEGIKLIDESIRIESEVDANKIITIKVFLGKVLLDSSLVQPFANEVLTTYQLEVKKIIRRINNSSALKDKGQISIEINKLVELHSKYNNHNEAFNTLVKYSPESYTALCYHAIKARLTSQRFYYAKLAYDLDKNGTSIFNYALGFPENSTEYEALLREGAEGYNDMHAKLHLGILLKSKGQMETAISLIEEAYNFYYSIYSGRKRGLAEWEYNGLKHCCIHLSKPELLKEIENILLLLKRNSDETKPYDSNNLLEYGSDIPKTGN